MDTPQIGVRRPNNEEGFLASVERITGWSPVVLGFGVVMVLSIAIAGASLIVFKDGRTPKPENDFGGAPPWAGSQTSSLPGAITRPQPRRQDSMAYVSRQEEPLTGSTENAPLNRPEAPAAPPAAQPRAQFIPVDEGSTRPGQRSYGSNNSRTNLSPVARGRDTQISGGGGQSGAAVSAQAGSVGAEASPRRPAGGDANYLSPEQISALRGDGSGGPGGAPRREFQAAKSGSRGLAQTQRALDQALYSVEAPAAQAAQRTTAGETGGGGAIGMDPGASHALAEGHGIQKFQEGAVPLGEK